MVLAHNVTLSNNTVVMVWISSDNVAAVAQKGYKLIHAASDFFYLVRVLSLCCESITNSTVGLWPWRMGWFLPDWVSTDRTAIS